MPYNQKQYDAALKYLSSADDNIVSEWDKKRVSVYDLYENLYNNSSFHLQLTLRGDDQYPILIPSGRKIIETTNRFLGIGFDYLIEAVGDQGLREAAEQYISDFWKREAVAQKFGSNKRWGLVRGDALFYLYGDLSKAPGKRISIAEIDPRQVFLIEDPQDTTKVIGVHIVEAVQDFREPDKPDKKIASRRTFRKEVNPDTNVATGRITFDLTHWPLGKWDDRMADFETSERIVSEKYDEELDELPEPITELPIYKWRNNPPQNSSWGVSQMSGLETIFYAINQSITDEDATIVFQGLGMYVTNARPPLDPNTQEVTDWNVGPMQIIEIGTDQKFERVTGVTSTAPYKEHVDMLDELGLTKSAGLPGVAVGKVDPSVVSSGIALKMELMPLLAANAEKELEFITVLDQMLHDLVTMWLPAYESEIFGDSLLMSELSCVCLFDDPMPVDRDAKIQETLLLRTSNLILGSMAVAQLRELGWKYPVADAQGNELDDEAIAAMLTEQAKGDADATAGSFGQQFGDGTGGGFGDGTDGTDPNAPTEPQTISLG